MKIEYTKLLTTADTLKNGKALCIVKRHKKIIGLICTIDDTTIMSCSRNADKIIGYLQLNKKES